MVEHYPQILASEDKAITIPSVRVGMGVCELNTSRVFVFQ